jgi:hypothetical protein
MKDVFVIRRHKLHNSPEYQKLMEERRAEKRKQYEARLTPEYVAFLESEVARMLKNKKGD